MKTPLTLTVTLAVLLNAAASQSGAVQWSGERLTVQAVNAPLRTLLEDVARRTGIVLTGADRLAGTCTVDIRDKPLAEALGVVLEHVNFIVTREHGLFHLRIHSMMGTAPPAVGPIVIAGLTDQVVTREDRSAAVPEPADPDDDDDETEKDEEQREEQEELETLAGLAARPATGANLLQLSNALVSDYSEVRIRALHLLAARSGDPDALEEIVSAFQDDEMNVVLTASDILASIPGEAAGEALQLQLANQGWPDAQFGALRALALRAEVSSIPAVRRIVRDGHPKVREFAAQLLTALEERARTAVKPQG